MNFWKDATGFFWGTESFPVLLMVLAVFALLYYFRGEDRPGLINTLGFYFACQFGQLLSGIVHALEFVRAADMLYEAVVIGTGIAVIRLWGLLVFRLLLPTFKLTLPRITEDIFVIVAYVAWFMVRLRIAGLDLGSILATSAVITAVIAFAMQDTLGNILGGLALQLDNSVEVGDWIKVDDISGKVVDIRWRSTLVETRNWETVVFPNSQLMKNKFLVLGRRTDQPVQWRRWIWFNVSLEVHPSRVISVVEEALLNTEITHVARTPQPNCVLMDMDNKGYARYALRYWLTDLAVDDPTDGVVRWHIMTALQRAGLKLAMEEHGILITKENEKHEEAVRLREVGLRIKILRRVELFSSLTDVELQALAERLKYSPFASGNLITSQGDERSHWLYVIIRGEAEVFLNTPGGGKRMISILGKGSFFGEMALLTGAPRRASVRAKTDVECYRLDKDAFEEILRARPSIADEVSHILAERTAQLDSALQDMGAVAVQHDLARSHNEILATIKRFFSLNI